MILYQCAKRTAAAALAVLLICSLVLFPGLTAKAEDTGAYSAQLNMNLDGQELCVKLCADLAKGLFSAQGQLGDDEQLGLFFSEAAIVLQDSLMLGGTYGVDLENLAKNLPGSVFAPDSGSTLALDQVLYDALMDSSEEEAASVAIIGGADGPTAIYVTGDSDSSLENLIKTLTKSANMKIGPGEVTVGSDTIKTTETTVSFGPEGMADLAERVLDSVKDDEAVKDALSQLLATDREVVESLFTDVDATVASLRDALVQGDAHFTATTAVDKQTKELVSAFASWTYNGETSSINAIFTGSVYSLALDSGDGQSLTIALNLEENDDSALAFRFYMTDGDAPNSQISFRWDKTAGTYTFTAENGDEVDELTGTIQVLEDAVVITADTANGQELEELSLTLRRDDSVSLPAFQDIVTMSEDEILQILHSVISTVEAVLGEAA